MNPNIIPAIQNFGGFAFALDSDNIPYYFNKQGSWDWMHKDPSVTPTEVHSAAGNMSAVAGGFKYFYTEIHRASGNTIHSCHETNPSPISTITGNFTSKKVVLTLPASAVNGFTDKLKIYGTEDGKSIFYYLGWVDIGTTTFDDDNIARDANVAFGKLTTAVDNTVSQTYLNYPVKNHRYLIATKTRILVWGIKKKTDGTASFTNGSATVMGTDSLWTRALVGDYIRKENDTRKYLVSDWTSATEITISENYGGTTESDVNYVIEGVDDIFRWTAKHPMTAMPMWWAFPTDFYRRVVSKDYSPAMGCNKIGNQPVLFKQHSHYLLSESGDDWAVQEARTKVGTGSHWSIVETSELGTLIFVSYEGLVYESTGVEAKDLGIDLSKAPGGINRSRLEYIQARWLDNLKWYMLIYSSEGSSVHDRILFLDYTLKEWVLLGIKINCIGYIKSSDNGQTVFKPWFGTVGGFVYKGLTGSSLGTGTSGTVKGTITGKGDDYIDDSTATFFTDGDGHKDVYVSLFDTDGVFQEEQKISSNTATRLTVDTNWTSSPQVGWTYEVGSIRWHWKSKVHDFDNNKSKGLDTVLMNFKKVAEERNVDIKIFVSEDPDMPDDEDQTITFDLSQDYYEPLGIRDNRARYFQYEICGHGVNEEVTIHNLEFELSQYLR